MILADRTPQDELNDFLQSELYHTLGSYGTAVQRLRALDERLMPRRRLPPWNALFPRGVVGRMREYNEKLLEQMHQPAHLHPDCGTLSHARHPPQHPDPGESLGGEDERYQWVLDFYDSAVASLEVAAGRRAPACPSQRQLGDVLRIVHDPQRGATSDDRRLLDGRIRRNARRLSHARDRLGREPGADRSREILADCLETTDGTPLHTQVLGALVEAHMRMHRAEHVLSHSFGDKIGLGLEIDRAVRDELPQSIVLNTFVYVAGRTVPWIFAADTEERDYVFANYEPCCDTLTPTYCLWIASQASLLALHRRAYTWLLLGELDKAYKDFHKLKRFTRGIEHRLNARFAHAPGAQTFLDGLAAFADHHSGRIYRVQHAHTGALRHFDRAATRLARLEANPELREMLCNSRWRVSLLISQAKANYELGHVKRSLLCYVRAWRAFLELADTESSARARFTVVNEAIAWLESVDGDAEVDKLELRERLTPLVDQLQMVRSPAHLRVLAAEIMMRLAHVLFILKLPAPRDADVQRRDRVPLVDHRLAYACLLQAARLDRTNTLIAADLLKIRHAAENGDSSVALPDDAAVPGMESIDGQWPGGGGLFEETARVVEYVLQSWLEGSGRRRRRGSHNRRIAHQLLTAFLLHTDSTNVKLAQVYRYLMQEASVEADDDRGGASGERASDSVSLELVCLRRYSSFFPFLPRPSAFRVLGGGYFLRVGEQSAPPFGIAIDPGPNFVDNLYRCGYCLADVDFVLITHDHADHIAALDAMLALLGYRAKLGDKTFSHRRRLVILGNESVATRYAFYNDRGRPDAVSVWSFEEWNAAHTAGRPRPRGVRSTARLHWPRGSTLRIEPVETYSHTDAGGHVAQGVLVSIGGGEDSSSILFTSDTGPAPSFAARARPDPRVSAGIRVEEAIERAAVIVAHVSAAPLPQLRTLAGLDRPPSAGREHTDAFHDLWDRYRTDIGAILGDPESDEDVAWAQKQRFVLRQLQFGFHSGPERDREQSLSGLEVSPLSSCRDIGPQSERHLYLDGLLGIAHRIAQSERGKLLLVGELREELGTFRTRIARALNEVLFHDDHAHALTMDIGLRVRLQREEGAPSSLEVLCTTCDLDNDLVPEERFHTADQIYEVCVKGEDEGIFYNCESHDPQRQQQPSWVERVERYDPFGR